MNMKKTIAAIAAGAVAVSAMATTVSALDDQTLSYNLVSEVKSSSTATITATFSELTLVAGEYVYVDVIGLGDKFNVYNSTVSISGSYLDGNGAIKPIVNTVYTGRAATWVDGYSIEGSTCWADSSGNAIDNAGNTWDSKYLKIPVVTAGAGTNKSLVASTAAELKVTVKYTEMGNASGKGDVAAALLNGEIGVRLATGASGDDALILALGSGNVTAEKVFGSLPGVTPTVAATVTGWISGVSGLAQGSEDAALKQAPFMTDSRTSAVSLGGWFQNPDIIQHLENSPVNSAAFSTSKDYYKNHGYSGNYGSYTNVGAVLNDAIENYDVTFVFHTAAQNVKIEYAADGTVDVWEYTSDAAKAKYVDNGKAKEIVDCTKFGQSLYPLYNWEGSGFLGGGWNGQNLFAGALVVNGGMTMGLSETEAFDFTETTLSFDWDTIVENSISSNPVTTYIRTLGLATSTTWFWDKMDVVCAARVEDTAESGEGAEVGDDVIGGDDEIDGGDEIDLGGEDGGDEIDTTEVPETKEVPEVSQPAKTGNASVALAVIPVALAAAAVVAKKRG